MFNPFANTETKSSDINQKINEIKVSEDFVDAFFYEVVKAKKEGTGKIKIDFPVIKKSFSHPSFAQPEKELVKQAQKISVLEEMPIPVPRPVLLPQQKAKQTISQIALPPPPRYLSRENLQIKQSNQQNTSMFMDLGQLNLLINDFETTLIQCDGTNQPLRINKAGKLVMTDIALNETEIMDVINKFSSRAQTPVTQPIFRASTEHLAITAIISSLGSKFVIIKK